MFQKLANHNEDLQRLLVKGYACSVDGTYLVVRDIPYLDHQGALQLGAFVTDLEFVDKDRVKQKNHQVYFTGTPHGTDGKPIPYLGGGAATLTLSEASPDVTVTRIFSHKFKSNGQLRDYVDFFEKIENYVTTIAGPAMSRYDTTPYTFAEPKSSAADPIFKFQDTLTGRARMSDLAVKFEYDIIAIIGLGGTGSYLLDFLVKTRVREIRAFDFDPFHVHNAFRSPGRLTEAELGKPKTEVYGSRYENFRTGLTFTRKLIDATCHDDLAGVTFAFVCVDKGSSRSQIFDLLLSKGIPFIDVGMGLNRKHGPLNGMMRVTHYSAEDGAKVRAMGLAELTDSPGEEYRNNIQISELNALNACLAMIKFKQLRGFYLEQDPAYSMLFEMGDLSIANRTHAKND